MTDQKEVIAKRGKIRIEFDPAEDYEGGTPILVIYGNWEYTGTYFAVIDWMEIDQYQLSEKQWEWLDNQWDKVKEYYERLEH